MIKILIVTNNVDEWWEKIRNSIVKPSYHITKNEIIVHNDFIAVRIIDSIRLSKGCRYNSIILDKKMADGEMDILRPMIYSTITTENYFKETISMYVNLNKINDFKEFVNITARINGDVIVSSNNYTVDGKSIMGLMSLDLSKPIKIEIPINTGEDIINAFKKFTVDNKNREN